MSGAKKRGAVRQLTKDDDPDSDEDSPTEPGTFKKASDEVLATRRIVKVRRTGSETPAAAAPPPNLFAGIQFTVPEITTPVPKLVTTGSDGTAVPSADLLLEARVRAAEVVANNSEVESGEGKVNGNGNSEEKTIENGDKEQLTEAGKPPTSFQQVSSTPNAFGSFSASAFSFSSTGSAGSAPLFSFGSSSNAAGSGFSFNNASETKSSGFGSSAPSSSSSPAAIQQSQATVSLQEVPTETGEENETAVFASDAVLYEFVDKLWKERGKGELKMNLTTGGDAKARLVMRSKGNFKLLLNAGLFPDMKTSKMDNRSVTFVCANSAAGKEAGVLTTYAVKLKESGALGEFMALVDQHKGVKSSSVKSSAVAVAEGKQSAEKEAEAEGGGCSEQQSGDREEAAM